MKSPLESNLDLACVKGLSSVSEERTLEFIFKVELGHVLISILDCALNYFLMNLLDALAISLDGHPMLIVDSLLFELAISLAHFLLKFCSLIALLPEITSALYCLSVGINEEC
jgi:hypothetical protein